MKQKNKKNTKFNKGIILVFAILLTGVFILALTACGGGSSTPDDTHTCIWDNWVITTAATATTKGIEKRTCTICGDTQTRDIPATGGGDGFTAVTSITGIPTGGLAEVPITLAGTVNPTNATNKTIIWSVVNAGTTGAAITGNTLNTTAAGTVRIRATITNGTAQGTNYIQNFDITISTEYVAVTSISGVPASGQAGIPLTLTGTVNPANATNKSITWSIWDAGTTGAVINGNILNTTGIGTVTIRATIENGTAQGTSYTQNFNITIDIVPVTSITGVPTGGLAGIPLALTGAVNPDNATNKTIAWSVVNAGTTGAAISGNTLNTTAAGTAVVRATVTNGTAQGTNYTQNFDITISTDYVAVTSITGVPTSGQAGIPLTLTGTVNPTNATNKTIVWSVINAGTTGASISGNTLNTTAGGTVTVRATITNGTAQGTNYTQDFNITINIVAVTSITGVPTSGQAGVPLTLTGTVNPNNATNKNITWSVVNAGVTGATISDNTLYTTAAGTVSVRATIINGTAQGTNYTQNFNITINVVAVTSITGVPTSGLAGTPLTLTGAVNPTNATNKTIAWSVVNAGTTGAAISSNTLNITAAGTVTIRATITNGTAQGTNYTQDFDISISTDYIAATSITDVPTSGYAGIPLVLTGTVNPTNATNKSISWFVLYDTTGFTGATINGNILNTTGPGTVLVGASIENVEVGGSDLVQYFYIEIAVVAVTSITGVPTSGQAGVPLTLTGTVNPTNATNKNITWSVVSTGTTGATISGNTLNTTAGGTVTVRATITNGTAQWTNYTQNFSITIMQNVSQGRFEYYWVNEHGSLVTTSGGATSVVPGTALTITAQSTGYIVKHWYLNGEDTGQSGNTYSFVSTTTGQHTVSLFVEKDGKLYNTNIIITVQ